MKFFLISDNSDTLTGLRLSGIRGIVVHEKEEILSALEKACADQSVGIILVTEVILQKASQEIDKIKLDKNKPIITAIPDRHGIKRSKDYLTNYIKESIGIKL